MSVIAQYAPDGSRQAWYTQSLARIDEVLSVVNGQGKFWYQSDALGSTYALANGAGAVVARGGYDVFGEPVPVSGNVSQPFGFTGREHELDVGFVYARARYMSTVTGRWDRPDPAGFVDGPNRYWYVGQVPTVFMDPDGLMSTDFNTTQDKSLLCVVGARDYPAVQAKYKQAQDIAFNAVLDAITGFGPEVKPGAGFASTQDIQQYWAFAELPGTEPVVQFSKNLGAQYANTAVNPFYVAAGPITISKRALDMSPLFLAHTIVHEMAHYLRWSKGSGTRPRYHQQVIFNMGRESEWKTDRDVPYEGYSAELAVFGSVREHD